MSYEDAIIQFLSQPENFSVALEVAARIQSVKNKLFEDFWKKIKENLELKLKALPPESTLKDNWTLREVKDAIFLGSTKIQDQKLYLQPTIEFDKSGNFYHGVAWNCYQQTAPDINIKELGELRQLLREKYEGAFAEDDLRWGLAYRNICDDFKTDEFYKRISDDMKNVTADISETFWDFFITVAERISNLNAALRRNET